MSDTGQMEQGHVNVHSNLLGISQSLILAICVTTNTRDALAVFQRQQGQSDFIFNPTWLNIFWMNRLMHC